MVLDSLDILLELFGLSRFGLEARVAVTVAVDG